MNGIGDAFKVFDRRLYEDKPRPNILPIREQLQDKPRLSSDAVKIDLREVSRQAAKLRAKDEESAELDLKFSRSEEALEPEKKEKEGVSKIDIQV